MRDELFGSPAPTRARAIAADLPLQSVRALVVIECAQGLAPEILQRQGLAQVERSKYQTIGVSTQRRLKVKHPGPRRPRWMVLIRDAHVGYISWEEFERNQVMLKQNLAAYGSGSGRGALPREGSGLLQGHVICGRCGSRMRTRYQQDPRLRDRLLPYYVCTEDVVRRSGKACQSILGRDVDAAVREVLLRTVAPAAIEVALAVQDEIGGRIEQADGLRQQQLERARYEAELKRRRFLKCNPDHRLVADALEADWNEQLRRLEALQQQHERQRQADQGLFRAIRSASSTPPAVSHVQQMPSGNPYNCAGQHPFHSRAVRTFVSNERRSAVPLAPLRRRSTLTPVKYEKLDGLGSRWCQSTRIGSGYTLRTHQQLLGAFLTPSCVSERLTRRMNSSSLYD